MGLGTGIGEVEKRGGRRGRDFRDRQGDLLPAPLLGARLGELVLGDVGGGLAVAVELDAGKVARAMRPLDGRVLGALPLLVGGAEVALELRGGGHCCGGGVVGKSWGGSAEWCCCLGRDAVRGGDGCRRQVCRRRAM